MKHAKFEDGTHKVFAKPTGKNQERADLAIV
jgi:hypothetical protein